MADLVRLSGEFQHQLILHPASIDDLKRDGNAERRAVNLAKVAKYAVLEGPPEPSSEDLNKLGLVDSNEHERVDNRILFAIYRDAANILVTEDIRLHKKAARIGLAERVHYTQQTVEAIHRLHGRVPVALPNIEQVRLYAIDPAIPFFDSLRAGYAGFDKWFKESAQSGRHAWIHRAADGQLGAICIFKEEKDEEVTDAGQRLAGRALKLCTFKVGESVRGRKVGELMLKAAFRYASDNGLEHVYLTMKAEQTYLKDLVEDFGFYRMGAFKADDVYVKDHPKSPPQSTLSGLDYHVHFFPHFRADGVGKLIVPIQPQYHEVLFADHPVNQKQLNLFTPPNVAGNAIKLAYLCHSPIQGMAEGDVLLFYRSGDMQAVTSVGIVDYVADLKEADKIVQLVSKRTVYKIGQIEAMATKRTKVLLFRLAAHLAAPVPREVLATGGGLKGNVQSIRRVTDEFFHWFVGQAKLGNCLSSN
jgi:predicted GNAT family N-acyltransferase